LVTAWQLASGKWQVAMANDKGNGNRHGPPFAVVFDVVVAVRQLPIANCQFFLFCFGCCSGGSQVGGKSVE